MGRAYDADRSRARLLDAAQALFSDRGFDATTTRQIAERAGVDAALIARYFGNKEKLYIAAVAADGGSGSLDESGPELSAENIATWILRRTRDSGPGPIMQALLRSETAPEIRAAATARLEQLFIAPLTDGLARSGAADARLRAEIIVYAVIGIVIGQTAIDSELSRADLELVVALVARAMAGLAG